MVGSIKELLQGILENSKERVKSPLIFSYIVAFFAYNWRPISILLFSKKIIEDKIDFINWHYCFWDAVLIPLLVAFVYVLFLPYVNLGIDYMLSIFTKKNEERQRTVRFSILQDKVEEADYDRKITEKRTGTSTIQDLEVQINVLTEQKNQLSTQLQDAVSRHTASIEQHKYEVSILEETLKNLKKEKDLDNWSVNDSRKRYVIPLKNRELFMNEIQKKEFVRVYDILFAGKSVYLTEVKDLNFFLEQNLLDIRENKVFITLDGESAYYYIKKIR